MTLSCKLKGSQKLFFLQLGQAASCCKSYLQPLPTVVDDLLLHWQNQSRQLDDGVPVDDCSVCWRQEQQGLTSHRLTHGHADSNAIELYLDNTCNQMCSYCSPKFSSEWENSIAKQGQFKNISSSAKQNLSLPTKHSVDRWLDYLQSYISQQQPNSVSLKVLGGEPLMQIRSLQKLIEMNSQQIKQLAINTNLNPPNSKFLDWLLESVPAAKLHFDLSLDATPEYNHVPRAGFDAKKFEDNLHKIQQSGVSYRFNSVISVLSVFDLPNYVRWIEPYTVNFFKVNNPDCLDPKWLPKWVLEQIAGQFSNHPLVFSELLTLEQSLIDIKLIEQYNYLTQYFSRTDTDPTTVDNAVFQQYWLWLKNKGTK